MTGAGTMAAKRSKTGKRKTVSLPQPEWDMGTGTAAQRAGLVIEDARWWDEDRQRWVNPNGVKRARRINLCETYHRKGWLTARQFSASEALVTAWEATMKSPPAIKKVQVDTFPKPDAHIAILIDRISRFHAVMGKVGRDDRELIVHVVLDNRVPTTLPAYAHCKGRRYREGIDALAAALEALADAMDGPRKRPA